MKSLNELIHDRFAEYARQRWANMTPEQKTEFQKKLAKSQQARRKREKEESLDKK